MFWLTGRTRVECWLTVTDNAIARFAEEYRLPLLPPALALLGMTAVIEVFVCPDAWPTYPNWAEPLL